MNYKRYLQLQNRLEWFYDFHPDFFDDIPTDQKKLLQETFLYDTPDSDYPESIKDFYSQNISNNHELDKDILIAVDSLYKAAGAGSVYDYLED